MNRRDFLVTTAGVLAATTAGQTPLRAAEESRVESSSPGLIDTNINLGRWSFRRLPLDETPALVAKLRSQGVTQAWAGSFDALLHKDISAVNGRLANECRTAGGDLLVPIGVINPMFTGWEEDLRRCAEVHAMPGIRLHPNYHGYKLSDPIFESVLKRASGYGLFVQIALIMEEERTIHPLVNVPATDAAPLAALAKKFPRARIQLLNAFRTLRGKPVQELAAAGVRFEIATLEGVAGVGNLLAQIAPDTLLFGSHAPFFYFESAKLKLRESVLSAAQLAAISTHSARQFLSAR